MKEDTIRQVREVESQAETKTQEAKAQADTIIHEARHKAGEVRQQILAAARAKAKELFEVGVKEFEPELANVRQTFAQEIAKDSEQAQQTMDAVVDFVVAKFQERLGSERH